MTTEHERGGSPSRRALVKGAAWTTPVIVMASPMAAAATSPACTTSVSVVSRCRVIIVLPFRQYTVCFTNNCPPGTPPVTVSNVTVSGAGDTDTLPGTVTIGPGQSGCITGNWEAALFAPSTVTVSYTVTGGTGNSPEAGLSVAPCGTTTDGSVRRAADPTPPDGTTVTLEDGRTLTVKDGQLVDESGRVITSEEDLRAPAPKTRQPEAPASMPGSGETALAEPTISPSATAEAGASSPTDGTPASEPSGD